MKHSTFYVEGAKVAMDLLGLTKQAQPLSAGRMLLGGIGRSAARGAATGAATGGAAGFVASPEGEGGSGFLRGMGYGALTGGLVGGAAGGLKTRAFQQKHPSYVDRANRGVERAGERSRAAMGDMQGPIQDPSTSMMAGHSRVMNRLDTGRLAGGIAGGIAGGASGLGINKMQDNYQKNTDYLRQLGLSS